MISLKIDASELVRMVGHMKLLALVAQRPRPLMSTVAKGVAHQTQVRIQNEKTSPAGTPWKPWSESYARTRVAGNSLLIDSHDLIESITGEPRGQREALIFSGVRYAGTHQFGRGGIPARPYLGLSDSNASEIEQWLGQAMHDVLMTGEAPV